MKRIRRNFQVEMILITGGNGFIGKHLQEKFMKEGIEFVAPSRGELDITKKINNLKNIDAVYHLAAILKSENYDETYKCNVEGTRNILELCKINRCKIIFLSSAAVYGVPNYNPIDEKHPANPVNDYGKTKLEAEKMCMEYQKDYGIGVLILRVFNVIGRRQREGMLFPDIMKQVADEKVNVVNLNSKRDYIDVKDLVDILFLIRKRDLKESVYNIGSGVSHSVGDILEIFKKYKQFEISSEERYGSVMDVAADITKIKEETGWMPKINLDKSIRNMMRNK